MSKPALAIYLKNHLRIAVKTRLGQGLTPHYAQAFYRLALTCLSENLPILAKHFDIFICPSASLDQAWAKAQWPQYTVLPQIEINDLGVRLNQTDQQIRALGYQQICIIGSDAPTLANHMILQAIHELTTHDTVLGPCFDGGFYLLGSNKALPSLCTIPWSSTKTLQAAKALFTSQDRSIAALPPWYDIDTVDDLNLLPSDLDDRSSAQQQLKIWLTQLPQVSIIIPIHNEASRITSFIKSLQQLTPVPEIIMVDGDSQDNSVALGDKLGIKIIRLQETNRAQQMNRGAQQASGNIYLFLHADSHLSLSAYHAMLNCLADENISGGCLSFALAQSQHSWRAWLIEKGVALRVKLFKTPYGDQGYFVKRAAFDRIGEYKIMPLLEDVEWFGRLKKQTKIVILKQKLITSARRFQSRGWLRSSLMNISIMLLYYCGVQPRKLARFYYGKKFSTIK
ncbi:MAG: TIGR04283 family arsenosugar biosynthesis glycosyltransferase [Gammaproteobacteria bacterium]